MNSPINLMKLDRAANHQLKSSDIQEYHRYKKELQQLGEENESIEAILRGFIWEKLEEYELTRDNEDLTDKLARERK